MKRTALGIALLWPLALSQPLPATTQSESAQRESTQRESAESEPAVPTTRPTTNPASQAGDPKPVAWPADRKLVLARVASRDVTLEELLQHVNQRLYRGFLDLDPKLHINPHLQRTLTLRNWTRQYTTLLALELETKERDIAPDRVEAKRKEAARIAFDAEMKRYMEDYRRRLQRDYPATPEQIASRRAEFLLRAGLTLEVEGILDAILPDELTQNYADKIHRNHPQIFNGYIDIAIITVETRDSTTGRRFSGARLKQQLARVSDIQQRLKKDGSNFEEVAAMFSDSRRALPSGMLSNVSRFNPTLPAIIRRTAWHLQDGQFEGPIESDYGMHWVRRIRYHSTSLILRLDATNKQIRDYIRQFDKENIVFDAIKRHGVEFLY